MLEQLYTNFHMWFVISMTFILLFLYVTQWLSLEVSSLLVLTSLLLFFHFFPFIASKDNQALDVGILLSGFSNPALIAVMCLLVVGEGMVRTGGLEDIGERIAGFGFHPILTLVFILVCVVLLSAFINNTPVVLIFIPILQALSSKSTLSDSETMLPLSFAAIVGGMITIIGSSTNLLISTSMNKLGLQELTFFEITPFGILLASVALIYIFLVLPIFLRTKTDTIDTSTDNRRQYVSQFVVPIDSTLIGDEPKLGTFNSLGDIKVRFILRDNDVFYYPFNNYKIDAGDTFIISATRKILTEISSYHPGLFHPPLIYGLDLQETRLREFQDSTDNNDEINKNKTSDTIMVEAMVTPSSRMVGLSIDQFELQQSRKAVFVGIQRRSGMTDERMTDIRIQSGDVLLLKGTPEQVDSLRPERDLVLISGTRGTIPNKTHAKTALLIFGLAVGLAASGFTSITVSAIAAATGMILTGCVNLSQATRALDRNIYLMVGTTLALGTAISMTGAASFISSLIISSLGDSSPIIILSTFFIVVALFTNILSNSACAILFTPIGVSLAVNLGIDPRVFAMTCLFACNCCFATPIGYQTNLMVMGPGQYQFSDFARAGLPLVFLLWLTFTFAAPFYWDL